MRYIVTRVFAVLTVLAQPVTATDFPAGLKKCGIHTRYEVISGDTLRLPDESQILLSDIKALEYWPPQSGYKSWPHGKAAKQALADHLSGQKITLFCGKKPTSHLNSTLAHVQLDNGEWLQQWLVENGHAYFFPRAGQSMGKISLLQAEDVARQEKHGLWANPALHRVEAKGENVNPGWFQIIKGRIVSANAVRSTIYLNYGADWRTDFTVQINKKISKKFERLGLNPLTFEGKTIEVRGWVEWSGGPKIILTHPDQIRLLPVG